MPYLLWLNVCQQKTHISDTLKKKGNFTSVVVWEWYSPVQCAHQDSPGMPFPRKQLLFPGNDVTWYRITSWPCPLPTTAKINPILARSRTTSLSFFCLRIFYNGLGNPWTSCSFLQANSNAAPLAALMQLFAGHQQNSLKERRMKSLIWMVCVDAPLSTETWFHSTSATWRRVRRKVLKCPGCQKHEGFTINYKSYSSSQFP